MHPTSYQSERREEQHWLDNNNHNYRQEHGRKFHAFGADMMPNPFMNPLQYRDLVKARQQRNNDLHGKKNYGMTEEKNYHNKLGYGLYGSSGHDIYPASANTQGHNYGYGTNIAMIHGKNQNHTSAYKEEDSSDSNDEEEEEHGSGHNRHNIWHANKQEHNYTHNTPLFNTNKEVHNYGKNAMLFNTKKQEHNNRHEDSSSEDEEGGSDHELVGNMEKMGVLTKAFAW